MVSTKEIIELVVRLIQNITYKLGIKRRKAIGILKDKIRDRIKLAKRFSKGNKYKVIKFKGFNFYKT